MAEPAYRNANYEDILTLPDHWVGEIIDGELHTHPRPAPRHARAYSALGYLVGGPFDGGRNGPGGWWVIDEPEIHLAGDILVPDLAGWRRERLPTLPDSAWFELVPDWVCEILSRRKTRKSANRHSRRSGSRWETFGHRISVSSGKIEPDIITHFEEKPIQSVPPTPRGFLYFPRYPPISNS